jgi:ribonuclease HII
VVSRLIVSGAVQGDHWHPASVIAKIRRARHIQELKLSF